MFINALFGVLFFGRVYAKDDYFVVAYQILAYLYTQLKAGDPVDPKLLRHDSKYVNINSSNEIFF